MGLMSADFLQSVRIAELVNMLELERSPQMILLGPFVITITESKKETPVPNGG